MRETGTEIILSVALSWLYSVGAGGGFCARPVSHCCAFRKASRGEGMGGRGKRKTNTGSV